MKLYGVSEVEAALTRVIAEASVAARQMVFQAAALVEAEAKKNFEGAHARGEPHTGGAKPNIVSGDLRRSILADPPTPLGAAAWRTRVAPTMVYGRRVELGFTGTDSLGRHYNQRPFPYFRPAVETVQPRLETLAVEVWTRYVQ